jgi:hypothetical protein
MRRCNSHGWSLIDLFASSLRFDVAKMERTGAARAVTRRRCGGWVRYSDRTGPSGPVGSMRWMKVRITKERQAGRFLHEPLHHGTQPLRAVVTGGRTPFFVRGGDLLCSKTSFDASSSPWQRPDSAIGLGLIGPDSCMGVRSGTFRMQCLVADTLPPVGKRCGGLQPDCYGLHGLKGRP